MMMKCIATTAVALVVLVLVPPTSHARVSIDLSDGTLTVECQKPRNKKVKPCRILVCTSEDGTKVKVFEGNDVGDSDDRGAWNMMTTRRGPNERAAFAVSRVQRIVLRGNKRSDHLQVEVPRRFAVSINGKGGDDEIISSGYSNDVIDGGDGSDYIFGGAGDDHLRGGSGGDEVHGGGGNDRLEGQNGKDRLVGGAGDDRLEGGPDVDNLYGNRKFSSEREGDGDHCNGQGAANSCYGCATTSNCTTVESR